MIKGNRITVFLSIVYACAIKMIAYRAETALVELLTPHLKKEEEARARTSAIGECRRHYPPSR